MDLISTYYQKSHYISKIFGFCISFSSTVYKGRWVTTFFSSQKHIAIWSNIIVYKEALFHVLSLSVETLLTFLRSFCKLAAKDNLQSVVIGCKLFSFSGLSEYSFKTFQFYSPTEGIFVSSKRAFFSRFISVFRFLFFCFHHRFSVFC